MLEQFNIAFSVFLQVCSCAPCVYLLSPFLLISEKVLLAVGRCENLQHHRSRSDPLVDLRRTCPVEAFQNVFLVRLKILFLPKCSLQRLNCCTNVERQTVGEQQRTTKELLTQEMYKERSQDFFLFTSKHQEQPSWKPNYGDVSFIQLSQ